MLASIPRLARRFSAGARPSAPAPAPALAIVGALRQEAGAAVSVAVGDRASLSRTFTAADLEAFAGVTGDRNPIHLDAAYASTTPFARRLVHGMLCANLFSAVFAARAPGSVYVSQTLRFAAPVHLGDTVTAHIEVKQLKARARLCRCRTWVVNETTGAEAVVGEASVLI